MSSVRWPAGYRVLDRSRFSGIPNDGVPRARNASRAQPRKSAEKSIGVCANGGRRRADVSSTKMEVGIAVQASRSLPVCGGTKNPSSSGGSGLCYHEHDGNGGERDAADGEQRDGAELQRDVAASSQRML